MPTDLQVEQAPPAVMAADAPEAPSPWKGRLEAARTRRAAYLPAWQENVEFRVGRVFEDTDEDGPDQVALMEDWSRTKQKQSQLSFQLPTILATHRDPASAPYVPHVSAAVNYALAKECKAHYMADECLADVINAAGLMASKISIEAVYETVEIEVPGDPVPGPPQLDPTTLTVVPGPMVPGPPVKKPQKRLVSRRLRWDRISPAHLLWPAEHFISNWDKAPWLGHDTLMPVEVVKKHPVWGPKVTALLKAGTLTVRDEPLENLAKGVGTADQQKAGTVPCLLVTEVWYYAAQLDADAVHPDHLRFKTFVEEHEVDGGDADEQVRQPQTDPNQPQTYRGLTCLPIRVETLTYVSDLAVPPSDSQVGRPQVKELMRSRAQMIKQRDTSIPIRWYDVNRVDEEVAEAIRRGVWQDMIPMNGPGDRAIGEVARANYPRETFQFQQVLSTDLDASWALSNNQRAMPNDTERSAAEVKVVESASQIRLDYEKARINRHLAEGAAIVWSLMQRYQMGPQYVNIIGEKGAKMLAEMPPEAYAGSYAFDFVPDSSDRIDLPTRQAQFTKVYNLMRKSPTANGLELDREMYRMHGKDPDQFVTEPTDPPPPPPSVSLRLDHESIQNPILMALVQRTYNITPEEIKAAAIMLKDAAVESLLPPPPEVADKAGALDSGVPGTAASAPEMPMSPESGGDEVLPPPSVEPILKRTNNGDRLT